jgi:hypothetical protein
LGAELGEQNGLALELGARNAELLAALGAHARRVLLSERLA